MVIASAKRALVRFMSQRGLSERRSLAVVAMSASAFRYQPGPDQNERLRAEILRLAQRYRRYGTPMIYLKLRQAGWIVNHKRVERLYAEQCLQVRRRRRKKVPIDRQPLIRPARANEVWSMDFVFDRVADGRALKYLGIVDDATHECVALVPDRSMMARKWPAYLMNWCSHAACRRSYDQITDPSSLAKPCSAGHMKTAFSSADPTRQAESERLYRVV